MKAKILILLSVLLLLAAGAALGETATEITGGIRFLQGGNDIQPKKQVKLADDDYTTYFTLKPGKLLTITSEQELGAVHLKFYDWVPDKMILEASVNGEWTPVDQPLIHLSDWYSLPAGTEGIRLVSKSKKNSWIAEVKLYTPGEKPEELQAWMELEKADLMLVVAHPDDDILWFGGLLPTYAKEKNCAVEVVYLVPTGGERKLELLDALWLCGVRGYPAFLNLIDKRAGNLEAQYQRWGGKNRVVGLVTKAFRQYKPEVVVTQGEKGEYGHAAHKVVCDACKIAFKNAANEKKSPVSYEKYGTWQVKKLYLHEYNENVIHQDWHIPLASFGGRDAFSIAVDAMACHASQVARGWALEDPGEHDNTKFGLYATVVGPDEEKNDMMEHITDLVGNVFGS